ncbi:O-Antigen ligase [Lacunisphaera limnophila]|uniref:O-Antigen ligase n=1 Tax=Lacunisphaera limnophila TaxID=1838286 RepID=A0A1D8AXX3_9BACT|nr:O-Antigen ligase [Lacunisphaera limnophila]
MERAVFFHLAILIVGLSWAFGGQSPFARQALMLWGTLGMLLFGTGAFLSPGKTAFRTAVRYLWPLLLFDLLTLVSAFNPSMQSVMRLGTPSFVVVDPLYAWLPSSARPDLTLRELWQFNGIVLSCFNGFLFLQRRRRIRTLLAVIAGNALVLAIFGTLQKLVGADGLWFGLVASPQPLFFSTFIYHNHWGAFTLLNLTAGLALLFDAWRRGGHRNVRHSPLLTGALALVILAISLPLSASRSCTVLGAALLLGALLHACARIIRDRRRGGQSTWLAVSALLLFTLLALGATGYLGRRVISERARLTDQQIRTASGLSEFGTYRDSYVASRLRVYRDTWRMAQARPYTGWGLESYATVFRIYDSSYYTYRDRFRARFSEAHSDWLQSLAESGFVGTGLLVLLGLVPLIGPAWRKTGSPIPRYLLTGCGLLLVYAWVEFPFANPSVMTGFWISLYLGCRYAGLDQRGEAGQTSP